ncbi:putative 5'-nucleotidase/2' 3'-cyclic phosphodiesterase [Thiobacillus denitrificans ATCC 25259]|uniref:Putative 5'-nucleotidase/2' 3'-cyclic phosphodiesterase n=1 Tax=Thiobacillus denitrificans (strain ATCC 25259 / T1) TaxID=292415 RepID=Q3SJC5_THIDA|nr:metallophosphoesterase [Thiobacillus denitrificans]AAZ97239.1 putative 5'-nucleotidase/2' 3'-cyclic phosphodiesterase [Thiobacillus denitrificans ATCC 25259]
MKNARSSKAKACAVAGFAWCAIGQAFAATPPDVKLTFIEINDLHANLIGHKDLVRKPDGTTAVAMRGGMARIKTIIDGARSTNPNTVVMNVGDTFHGGVEAFYSLGNAVAGPLNALGIDVGVAGNWDYYFTPGITRARYGRIVGLEDDVVEATLPGFDNPVPIKRPNFPNLGANVKDMTDPFMPKDFFAPTHMITRQGVKIGFIGFTSDIVEQMHPLLAEGMDFAYGLEEHKNLIIQHARALRRQGADIVVLMSELGIHKDIALSKRLAAMQSAGELEAGLLDAVFSAHTHELTEKPVAVSEDGSPLYAPVVEAGNDGQLGRLDVTMRYKGETTTRLGLRRAVTEQHWTPAATQWQILEVGESVPEDPTVKQLVDAERAPFLVPNPKLHALPFVMQSLNQPIDTVVTHIEPGSIVHQDALLSGVIHRNHSNESTFNNVFTQMLLDLSHDPELAIPDAKVSISPAFRMGATIPEARYLMENGVVATGALTLEDVYRFFPMYYGVVTAQTTGADLKRRVEDSLKHTYSSDAFNHGTGWATAWGGVKQTLDLGRGDPREDGQLSRLLSLRYDSGEEVRDDEVVTVIGCRRLPIDYVGTVCGQPGFANEQTVKRAGGVLPISMIDLFVDTLKRGYKLKTSKTSVEDLSRFAMFPSTPFIQPLEGTGGYVQPAPTEDPCGYLKWKCQPDQPL